jgi:hypothetical protein
MVLVTAWTDNLQAGTFVTSSPTGTPSFGQEIYPLAIRARTQIYQTIAESWSHHDGIGAATVSVSYQLLPVERLHERLPRVFASSDSCYLLMSLQR